MKPWPGAFSLMFVIVSTGCASVDSVLFVTKTSLGGDFDSKPPAASIAYDRVEGYIGPRYDNGAVPPVVARIQTDGRIFNTRVRQIYATGAAANLIADPQSPEGPTELSGNKRLMFFEATTTTGLKVTFTGQYPDSFHVGYKRKEFSFIPLGSTVNSAGKPVDIYPSVLASIDTAGRSETPQTTGLSIGQFFATGRTADLHAKKDEMRKIFEREAADAFAVYRESVVLQREQSTRILRCYAGVAQAHLPDVWQHAQTQGLFKEASSLDQVMAWYRASTAPDTPPADREPNLRRAHQRYAGDIADAEGTQPTRVRALETHRDKVCEIARR